MIIVKFGKNETAARSEIYAAIGSVATVKTKGSGMKNSMTRQDIFGGRQDGGKMYRGRIVSIESTLKGTILRVDCSKEYKSIVHEIPVANITEIISED